MKPPRCRVCGEEGYGHICAGVTLARLRERVQAKPAAKIEVRSVAKAEKPKADILNRAVNSTAPSGEGVALTGVAHAKARVPRKPKVVKAVKVEPAKTAEGKFDRKAYQREYMRQWRMSKVKPK